MEKEQEKDGGTRDVGVVSVCPVCRHCFVKGEVIVKNQYPMVGGGNAAMVSFPKTLCLNCGVEFIDKQILAEIKSRISGDKRIIDPGLFRTKGSH
jgi:hypothetical protein